MRRDNHMTSDDRLPVIVGVGQLRSNHDRTASGAGEPLDLIVEATHRAAADAGVGVGVGDVLARAVDDIGVVPPTVEGVLVTPMRTGGLELLVGVVRDEQWGPVLAVGLGGLFVEVLRDSALLRACPRPRGRSPRR